MKFFRLPMTCRRAGGRTGDALAALGVRLARPVP